MITRMWGAHCSALIIIPLLSGEEYEDSFMVRKDDSMDAERQRLSSVLPTPEKPSSLSLIQGR